MACAGPISNTPPSWCVLNANNGIFVRPCVLKHTLQPEILLDTKEGHLAVNTTLETQASVTNSFECYYLKLLLVLFFVCEKCFVSCWNIFCSHHVLNRDTKNCQRQPLSCLALRHWFARSHLQTTSWSVVVPQQHHSTVIVVFPQR